MTRSDHKAYYRHLITMEGAKPFHISTYVHVSEVVHVGPVENFQRAKNDVRNVSSSLYKAIVFYLWG